MFTNIALAFSAMTVVSTAFTDPSNAITYSGILVNSTTAQICIYAKGEKINPNSFFSHPSTTNEPLLYLYK
jgi:hypothetical protein